MEVHLGWNQLRRLNGLPASTRNQFAATFRHKAWNGVQNYCSNPVPKPKMGKCFHRCVFNQHVVGTPGRPFLVPTLWICRGRRSLERLQGQRPQTPPCHCMEIHTTPAKGSWKREGQEGERRNWSPQVSPMSWVTVESVWAPRMESGLWGMQILLKPSGLPSPDIYPTDFPWKHPRRSFGVKCSGREVCKELIHSASSSGRLD